MPIKYNNNTFVDISNKKHNFKYDYSLVEYKNNSTKIKIICKEHGIFEQRSDVHMRGGGCTKCVLEQNSLRYRFTKELFINNSIKIHGDKYDYSLVEYINNNTKIKIICKEHGIFEQSPRSHTLNKSGCPVCIGRNKTTEDFIKQSKNIHNDTYTYDNVKYINSITKVSIYCENHGIFNITPNNHLQGKGCPICRESHGEKSIRIFLESNNIEYISQKKFNDCKHKRPLPFDFYLPKYNMCIEFDGEQHFKKFRFELNDDKLIFRQKKDNIKSDYCLLNNINLLRITYKDNIINKLKERLNI